MARSIVIYATVICISGAFFQSASQAHKNPINPVLASLKCPATFNAEHVPAGWQIKRGESMRDRLKEESLSMNFVSVSPYLQDEAPDGHEIHGKYTVYIWPIFRDGDTFWMNCVYQPSGTTLARKIPDTVRSCSETYLKGIAVKGSFRCVMR